MNATWTSKDKAYALEEGWFISISGFFCACGVEWSNQFSPEELEKIVQKAEAGNEFYQRALAEAARRRVAS